MAYLISLFCYQSLQLREPLSKEKTKNCQLPNSGACSVSGRDLIYDIIVLPPEFFPTRPLHKGSLGSSTYLLLLYIKLYDVGIAR